ncbi:hypothetical protein BKA61DRAFT_663816 [Leptodontidium sp. MPI-SDFR-AT-0119]|nr:hypothetical protein BKA61DRAFT_663816 [Leptodontidium sp. MPI-SDFR-AT-0119]
MPPIIGLKYFVATVSLGGLATSLGVFNASLQKKNTPMKDTIKGIERDIQNLRREGEDRNANPVSDSGAFSKPS